MAKKKKSQNSNVRADPKTSVSWLCSDAAYETLCCAGYTTLAHNPEIRAAVNKICDMISSMTIYLMENTPKGDVRIKNELSRKVDISPNPNYTRKTMISSIVRALLLEGDGNCIVWPETKNGYLESLNIVPPSQVSLIGDWRTYEILVNGEYKNPDDLLHFVINPEPEKPWCGTGYRTTLKDVAQGLKQASATKKGFMESKWKPSVIVKVESMSEELSNASGRKKILEDYVTNTNAGEPWIIPADSFDVEVVKPLSLNDLAISDSVELDKKTVAAILDVPEFVVGVGKFDEKEWNNFVNTRIRLLCNAVEQELTRKLLISPNWYFKFNVRSLMAYDIEKLSRVAGDNYVRGIMTGNEVRDWIDLSPKDGLDELVILENYIPRGMIGNQNKLNGGE